MKMAAVRDAFESWFPVWLRIAGSILVGAWLVGAQYSDFKNTLTQLQKDNESEVRRQVETDKKIDSLGWSMVRVETYLHDVDGGLGKHYSDFPMPQQPTQ